MTETILRFLRLKGTIIIYLFMEAVMSTTEYNQTIKKLVKLMSLPKISDEVKGELEQILDRIDSYNGMDFLKVKSK